jgi:hypothetical protein
MHMERGAMATPLEKFTRTLLSRHGALVDVAPGGLEVVSGPVLAANLGLAEFQRLIFTPDSVRPDAAGRPQQDAGLRVDYDTPLVERMGRLVDTLGRVALWPSTVPAPKPIDADGQVRRGLTLHNGVVRVRGCKPATAVRLRLFFEYELLADEREGGSAQVWITPATRSVPRMAGWSPTDVDGSASPHAVTFDGRESMLALPWPLAFAAARAALAPVIDDFVERLGRRRDRDARRLREYSLDIDRAIRAKLNRAGANGDAQRRERDRLEATWRSYRSRLGEVADRYRLRVRLVPHGVIVCALPGFHVNVRLMRRTASSDVTLAWNPIDGQIEARACDGCEAPTPGAWLCDDRVHFVCGRCFAPCPRCDKPYCRACRQVCPRSACQK